MNFLKFYVIRSYLKPILWGLVKNFDGSLILFSFQFCQRTVSQDDELELLFAGLHLWADLSVQWQVSHEEVSWN